jgi:hypothetical protein
MANAHIAAHRPVNVGGTGVLIRRKHWGLQVGYDAVLDMRHGFYLCLGHRPGGYRLIIEAHWEWPRFSRSIGLARWPHHFGYEWYGTHNG